MPSSSKPGTHTRFWEVHNYCHAQTAGVPASWVNTTIVPSGSSGSTGGGRSAAGRRLQQQATQGITVTSRVASNNPEQVQTAINNAVSSGALGQALSGIGLTLVPSTSPVASPMVSIYL